MWYQERKCFPSCLQKHFSFYSWFLIMIHMSADIYYKLRLNYHCACALRPSFSLHPYFSLVWQNRSVQIMNPYWLSALLQDLSCQNSDIRYFQIRYQNSNLPVLEFSVRIHRFHFQTNILKFLQATKPLKFGKKRYNFNKFLAA